MRSYAFRVLRNVVDGRETVIHCRVEDPDVWWGPFHALFPGDPLILEDPHAVLYLQERIDEAMAKAIP